MNFCHCNSKLFIANNSYSIAVTFNYTYTKYYFIVDECTQMFTLIVQIAVIQCVVQCLPFTFEKINVNLLQTDNRNFMEMQRSFKTCSVDKCEADCSNWPDNKFEIISYNYTTHVCKCYKFDSMRLLPLQNVAPISNAVYMYKSYMLQRSDLRQRNLTPCELLNCGPNSECDVVSKTCHCWLGYLSTTFEQDGRACRDINECQMSNKTCNENGVFLYIKNFKLLILYTAFFVYFV